MTINIADNSPRVSYSVADGVTQTSFTVSFEFFDNDDLNVYVDGVLKTLVTDYTVTGGDGSTGTITMSVTGASGGSTVVITRDIDLERTTDFPPSGAFNIATLNTELDRLMAVAADLNDRAARAIQAQDFDSTVSYTLPLVDDRKGKVLGFNETTGAVEAGPEIADTQSLADVSADIALLADIEDGTTDTNAITNVNGIRTDVTTVSGISGNVTTVANNDANVTTVANNDADITTVATNISSVNTVATNIADVITVANDLNEAISEVDTVANDLNEAISEIETVAASITNVDLVGTDITNVNTTAGSISNVNTTATNIANVNTVAGIDSDVTTVAGISSDVTTVAADQTDIGTVSTNITNVNTVAGISGNVTTVAGISGNVTTVANNDANVTTVAGINSAVSTVAGISTDVTAVSNNNANVTTVAGSIANVNTAATDITNINTAATNISVINTVATAITDVSTVSSDIAAVITAANDLNEAVSEIETVANSITNVDAVGTNITNVNTVAGISSDVTTVAGISQSDLSTVATNATNVGTVAGSISNVNTVATNINNVNDFFNVYRVGSTDPTTSLDTGDLFYNTTTGSLKVYTGSAWEQGVTAGSGFLPLAGGTLTGALNGTTASFSGTVSASSYTGDGSGLSGINTDLVGDTTPQLGGNLDTNGYLIAGRNIATDGSKLDGIESGATADQTASEILTAVKTVDGAGSGLDADTVDGLNASSFLRSDTNNSYIQSVGRSTSWGVTNGTSTGALNAVMGTSSGATYLISGTSNGTFRAGWQVLDSGGSSQFQLNSNYYTLSGSTGTIWHSGNDGSGSGLDADTVDGYHANTGQSTNTVAVRDASGYLFASYFNGSGTFSASGNSSGMVNFTGTNGVDTYGRSYTGTAARAAMNLSPTDNVTFANVTATKFTATSDINLKENLEILESPTDKLSAISGYSYNFKETGEKSYGVIAQEVEGVLPDAVHTNDEGNKSVEYNAIIALLVEAVKSQQVQINELTRKLEG